MNDIAILIHEDLAPPGVITDWLDQRQRGWTLIATDDEHPDPTTIGAIVALGSSETASGRPSAWVSRKVAYLRSAIDSGLPILGICFGAQLLALACGGSVEQATEPEIGWIEPSSEHQLLRGPWLAWHYDAITLPNTARTLATTPTAVQAFCLGPHLGVQFHPEVTAGIVRAWIAQDPTAAVGHDGQPRLVASELPNLIKATQENAFALFDWWSSLQPDTSHPANHRQQPAKHPIKRTDR
jgi:GMP synthase-like glutamine amidotransferase